MSNKGIHSKLLILFSLLLTLLFVYTAVGKLIDLDTFQWRLARMPYISSFTSLISWGLPFLELVIAGLLWLPRYQIIALYGSLFLLASFTLYIALVLRYSDSIPCSCGGVISALGWTDHILLNVFFMTLSLLGILWSKKRYNIETH
ncbi:MauE/DoxX family redox-associated membrane protein [Flagellimonas iocasae]|uniref:MauE/DoxX family redox-associated membrane protein n=1 Tax=Flagellimonas iocasae TaxID=2055905 RepID=A0ABW4Y0Y7_9FLAO